MRSTSAAFTHWMIAGAKRFRAAVEFTLVEQRQAAEPRLVRSNHLLESLDKIRLPTNLNHGSAVCPRTPWPSSSMVAHRHNPPIGVKQYWLRKCE